MKNIFFIICFTAITALASCGNNESYVDGQDTTSSMLENQVSPDSFMTKENSEVSTPDSTQK